MNLAQAIKDHRRKYQKQWKHCPSSINRGTRFRLVKVIYVFSTHRVVQQEADWQPGIIFVKKNTICWVSWPSLWSIYTPLQVASKFWWVNCNTRGSLCRQLKRLSREYIHGQCIISQIEKKVGNVHQTVVLTSISSLQFYQNHRLLLFAEIVKRLYKAGRAVRQEQLDKDLFAKKQPCLK